jgi:hypothetical protein
LLTDILRRWTPRDSSFRSGSQEFPLVWPFSARESTAPIPFQVGGSTQSLPGLHTQSTMAVRSPLTPGPSLGAVAQRRVASKDDASSTPTLVGHIGAPHRSASAGEPSSGGHTPVQPSSASPTVRPEQHFEEANLEADIQARHASFPLINRTTPHSAYIQRSGTFSSSQPDNLLLTRLAPNTRTASVSYRSEGRWTPDNLPRTPVIRTTRTGSAKAVEQPVPEFSSPVGQTQGVGSTGVRVPQVMSPVPLTGIPAAITRLNSPVEASERNVLPSAHCRCCIPMPIVRKPCLRLRLNQSPTLTAVTSGSLYSAGVWNPQVTVCPDMAGCHRQRPILNRGTATPARIATPGSNLPFTAGCACLSENRHQPTNSYLLGFPMGHRLMGLVLLAPQYYLATSTPPGRKR